MASEHDGPASPLFEALPARQWDFALLDCAPGVGLLSERSGSGLDQRR